MPIPPEVLQLVGRAIDRGDFAFIRKDPRRKEWIVGVYNGRIREDGEPKETQRWGLKLSGVLLEVLAEPVAALPPLSLPKARAA